MTRDRAYRRALAPRVRVRRAALLCVLLCAAVATLTPIAGSSPTFGAAAGPRVRPGIPAGVTLTTTHPGGTLTPGLYDRVRFLDTVRAPCGVAIFRSSLPDFRSTCGTHDGRPLVAFSGVGDNDRCYGDAAAGYGHYIVWASVLRGSTDAVRLDGGDVSVADSTLEPYSCSSSDHNDGAQAYAVDGQTTMELVHNVVEGRPHGSTRSGNAAIFAADYSTGTLIIDGNLLAGGGYTIRLHESMHYRVTGNVVGAGTWLYGPVNVTAGAHVDEWAGNMLSDGTPLEP